jgi:amino acid transporter
MSMPAPLRLHRSLTLVEFFTFGFGSMVGVGWVVVIHDWMGRGGPAGAALGFLLGGILFLPIARTYGLLVRRIPDAGGEFAYAADVFPPAVGFAAGWTMILAYAIVCPWEVVAMGNLLGRAFPASNSWPLYSVAGSPIYLPRLVAGLAVAGLITAVNYRGIRLSGVFQNLTTFGLLAVFAAFTLMGFARGSADHLPPLFARPGTAGALLSIFLVMQIVPYFMTGFESVGKESEEARPGFDPRLFGRAIYMAVVAGFTFYVLVIAVVAYVHPWRELVAGRLGTEVAFERAFGSRAIAQGILAGAFLSLFKVFNGNFVAATRLLFAVGRRGLVHRSLSVVHPTFGTPTSAILLLSSLTVGAAFLGDAVLIPITEVGSLAVGVGWLSACLSHLARARRDRVAEGRLAAAAGAAVAATIVAMKVLPFVPGSFGRYEWLAFLFWCALGAGFWRARRTQAAVGASGS